MYTITKKFHFSASHTLDGLPKEHPCGKLHGHNYVVVFEFEATNLNDNGFVIDYRNLDVIKQFIDDHLDHTHLNNISDSITNFNPTSENLAKFLFDMFTRTFPQLLAVTVKETPKTSARYTPIFDKE